MDAAHPLVVFAFGYNSIKSFISFVTANGGSYSTTGMPTDNYYISCWYNAAGDGMANNETHIGDYFSYFGTSTCNWNNTTPVSISGNVTQNLSFTNTNQYSGMAGTITYNGLKGVVNYCNPLIVYFYQPGSTTPHITNSSGAGNFWGGGPQVRSNGGRYDAFPGIKTSDGCSSLLVDAIAFYSVPGIAPSYGGPSPSQPYTILSNISLSTLANQNIVFDDTNIW